MNKEEYEKRLADSQALARAVSARNHTILNLLDKRPPSIICDLDGTIAHFHDRHIYDYTAVEQDVLDVTIGMMLKTMENSGVSIIFVTARSTENGIYTERFVSRIGLENPLFFMRQDHTKEKDVDFKRRIYEDIIRKQYRVLFVLEDRKRVVDMYRSLGLLVFQVSEGNF